jgi:hypothetical protein
MILQEGEGNIKIRRANSHQYNECAGPDVRKSTSCALQYLVGAAAIESTVT